MERKNCWEFKGCDRQPGGNKVDKLGACKASIPNRYDGVNNGQHAGRFCWAIDDISGSYAEKLLSCINCDFFKQVNEEEGVNFILSPRKLDRVTAAFATPDAGIPRTKG